MKVVIIGGGESGFGASYLAKTNGMEVFVSDIGQIPNKYKHLLKKNNIEFEEKKHTESRILSADLVIKSPGVPKNSDIITKIKNKGIRLSSEIEFAASFTKAKIIAITGSNGKTTTTTLIYHILKNSGINVGLAGNIGKSFALQVAQKNYDYYVLEISSFQLEDIQFFRPYISLLLNLSPDHLDYYEYNYEKYALTKFKIIENQNNNDFFIYNQDDETICTLLNKFQLKSEILPFSGKKILPKGGFVMNNKIFISLANDFSMNVEELSLTGKHNILNSIAATLVSKILNISNDNIYNSLKTFRAIEHRLEQFIEINGVKYINDSKATNVNATYYALESMNAPTIWIVGGVDKGNDYTEIQELVEKKVKAIICLGKDNEKIINFFKGKKIIYNTSTLKECVKIAKSIAQKGDNVLLSPCCASFDLFKNYEDRGKQFKKEVSKLTQ